MRYVPSCSCYEDSSVSSMTIIKVTQPLRPSHTLCILYGDAWVQCVFYAIDYSNDTNSINNFNVLVEDTNMEIIILTAIY